MERIKPPWPSWIQRALGGEWLIRVLPFITVLLCASSLSLGWILDDLVHWDTILNRDGQTLAGAAQNLFRFVDGPNERAKWLELGMLPWWSSPDLRIGFWRPLSSATHWLDYQLWPGSPMLMHAHNLVWGAALVFLVGLLFRRLSASPAMAGLAAVLYALDVGHAFPFAWIANRNSIIASVFGVAALLMHDRWRTGGVRSAAPAAFVLFALSLLGGEFGTGTGGLLLSYALFLDREPRLGGRLLTLSPYILTGVVWLILWRGQGFGVEGSALYSDPAAEPLRFLKESSENALLLLVGQIYRVFDIASMLSPPARAVFVLFAAAAFTLFLLLCVVPLRRSRHTRFYFGAMLFAVVPVCATMPSIRLMLLSGIGACGLLAEIARHWVQVWHEGPKRSLSFAGISLAFVGFLLAISIFTAALIPTSLERVRRVNALAMAPPLTLPKEIQGRTIIALGSQGQFHFALMPIALPMQGREVPAAILNVFSAVSPTEVVREDEHTIVVTQAGGFVPPTGMLHGKPGPPIIDTYVPQLFDLVFRDPAKNSQPGETISCGGAAITILEVKDDGRPLRVQFKFPKPLEDDSYLWCTFKDGGLQEIQPPPIGSRVDFPPMGRLPL